MKKLFFLKSIVLVCVTCVNGYKAEAQYIHFNEVYQYYDVYHNPNTYDVYLLHNKYYTYASTFDPNLNVRVVVMNIELDGTLISEVISDPDIEINTYGLSENATLMLSDSSVVGIRPISNSNCLGLQAIGLVKFVDQEFQWSQDYSSLNSDCNLYHRFYPKGLANINDSTFMLYSLMRIGSSPNNPIESGSAFTYFNYDGEVVGHYEVVDAVNTEYAHENLHEVHVLADRIIGLGNNHGYSNFITQYDFEANMIDSINLGVEDFANGSNIGAIMNDGNLLVVNGRTTFHTLLLDPFIMELYATRINTSNLNIISDIHIPTPADGILAHGVGANMTLKTSNNELLVVGGYLLEPYVYIPVIWKLDNLGNVIWQRDGYAPPIPTDTYYFTSVLEAPDGGYLLTGVVTAEENTVQKTWLLKIDACGYEQPSGCPEVVGIEGDGRHPELDSWSFPVWPNPFYNQLKAVLPPTATRVFISDATGRIVFEEKVFYPNQTWNLSALSDGVYVLSVALESGQVISERIVKR